MAFFTPKYFEEIEIGERSATTGRTITEFDLANFAALTWDTYSLHTDVEYAKNTAYGGRIAHGMLVLSYAIGLLSREPSTVLAFYGLDSIRFTAPVKIGDTIHVEVEVLDKQDKNAKGGVVTAMLVIKNQRDETVIVGQTKTLIAHQPEQPKF